MTAALADIVASRLPALRDLCRQWQVQRLELFGSATGDAFDSASSDLDFVVEFEPLAPTDRADAYFGLLFDLEALFGRAVDLVERDAVRNPIIRAAIERDSAVVYAAA